MADQKRPRLVSSCSEPMKLFVTTFCAAEGITESELIRLSLAQYMDYTLTPEDAEAPKPKRESRKRTAETLSKRQVAIREAMAKARADSAIRQQAIRQRLEQGQPV